MAETTNILFAGVGGQGVVKSADICSLAALNAGMDVKKSDTKGIARRKGRVVSHLRFGSKVYSPRIEKGRADFLVLLDESEGDLLQSFLAPEGIAIKVPAELRRIFKRFTNSAALGILSRYLDFSEDLWYEALKSAVPEATIADNIKAFRTGREVKITVEVAI